MPPPYTTQVMDGITVWVNAQGDQVVHYPDMLLHTLLVRTLDQAERARAVPERVLVRLAQGVIAAWPRHVADTAEQFNARWALIEDFRSAGLLP
jgi:hypothetical protein